MMGMGEILLEGLAVKHRDLEDVALHHVDVLPKEGSDNSLLSCAGWPR